MLRRALKKARFSQIFFHANLIYFIFFLNNRSKKFYSFFEVKLISSPLGIQLKLNRKLHLNFVFLYLNYIYLQNKKWCSKLQICFLKI